MTIALRRKLEFSSYYPPRVSSRYILEPFTKSWTQRSFDVSSFDIHQCSNCGFLWLAEDIFNAPVKKHDEIYHFKSCPHCSEAFDEFEVSSQE